MFEFPRSALYLATVIASSAAASLFHNVLPGSHLDNPVPQYVNSNDKELFHEHIGRGNVYNDFYNRPQLYYAEESAKYTPLNKYPVFRPNYHFDDFVDYDEDEQNDNQQDDDSNIPTSYNNAYKYNPLSFADRYRRKENTRRYRAYDEDMRDYVYDPLNVAARYRQSKQNTRRFRSYDDDLPDYVYDPLNVAVRYKPAKRNTRRYRSYDDDLPDYVYDPLNVAVRYKPAKRNTRRYRSYDDDEPDYIYDPLNVAVRYKPAKRNTRRFRPYDDILDYEFDPINLDSKYKYAMETTRHSQPHYQEPNYVNDLLTTGLRYRQANKKTRRYRSYDDDIPDFVYIPENSEPRHWRLRSSDVDALVNEIMKQLEVSSLSKSTRGQRGSPTKDDVSIPKQSSSKQDPQKLTGSQRSKTSRSLPPSPASPETAHVQEAEEGEELLAARIDSSSAEDSGDDAKEAESSQDK